MSRDDEMVSLDGFNEWGRVLSVDENSAAWKVNILYNTLGQIISYFREKPSGDTTPFAIVRSTLTVAASAPGRHAARRARAGESLITKDARRLNQTSAETETLYPLVRYPSPGHKIWWRRVRATAFSIVSSQGKKNQDTTMGPLAPRASLREDV